MHRDENGTHVTRYRSRGGGCAGCGLGGRRFRPVWPRLTFERICFLGPLTGAFGSQRDGSPRAGEFGSGIGCVCRAVERHRVSHSRWPVETQFLSYGDHEIRALTCSSAHDGWLRAARSRTWTEDYWDLGADQQANRAKPAKPECYPGLNEPGISFAFSFLCRLAATGYRNWPWSHIPEPSQVLPGSAGKSRTHLQAETATPRGQHPCREAAQSNPLVQRTRVPRFRFQFERQWPRAAESRTREGRTIMYK